jgi:hypothetical protein
MEALSVVATIANTFVHLPDALPDHPVHPKASSTSQVLLLLPALGLTLVAEEMFYSRPPNQRLWPEALEQGRIAKPSYLEVCAGESDGGACSPTVVLEFSELIKADQVQLIPDQGHQLAATVVQSVVGLFLKNSG